MRIFCSRKFCELAVGCIAFCFSFQLFAANPILENAPLFSTTNIKPNLMLSVDDSGSMDYEMLFNTTIDGNLWLQKNFIVLDTNLLLSGFVDSGLLSAGNYYPGETGQERYVYLFPNGTGTPGKRAYGDSQNYFAVPPFPQYAFARSSAYNSLYYDPNVTYKPWASYASQNFGNIDPTQAPADPVTDTATRVNLTQIIENATADYRFRLYNYMVVPGGIRYFHPLFFSWVTQLVDEPVLFGPYSLGISYYPATYYTKVTTGSFSISAITGLLDHDVSGILCSSLLKFVPGSDNLIYSLFERAPAAFNFVGMDAIGPDGSCLKKYEVKSTTASYPHNGSRSDCANSSSCTYNEQIQNFANWFTYYRRRHLAVRAGVGLAFENSKNIRSGIFQTTNQSGNVTMRDMSSPTDYTAFYQTLYNIDANNVVASENRRAIDYAGQQYNRTGSGAPITNACQKNFTFAVTDGFSDPSGAGLSNVDGSKGAPFQDSFSDTFADAVMKYYDTRLRTDLGANRVPVASGCNVFPADPQLDCNDDLHMNTFAVGLGASGNSIYGKPYTNPTTGTTATYQNASDAHVQAPAWTEVSDESAVKDGRQIDDLYHGIVNGHGELLNARKPQELKDALSTTLQGITGISSGVSAAVTFNTATLQTNSAVYLAYFNPSNWSGDLWALDLDSNGNVDPTILWSATAKLDALDPNTRTILTYNGSSGTGFRWNNLISAQQADLNQVPGGNGQNGLDFLRGDRSHEAAGQFRIRKTLLGDIVHSGPVFVGKPNLTWPNSAPFPNVAPNRYLDFRTELSKPEKLRKEIVYFGSNDGMLHGVRAIDGVEVLAYIPKNLYSSSAQTGLHYLADPTYAHRYFVDLAPTVSDVYLRLPADTVDTWHTILIGAERSGGRGLFALDVTNPGLASDASDPGKFSESNASSLVLWEFTHLDIGGNLGFTYSKPTIALMENGRWAAVFGNGYNDTGDGKAKLFIVFIDGGFDGTWTDGTGGSTVDYMVITTEVGDTTERNGLATPAVVDIDGNGAADRAYAGDLKGNLWAFDLSDKGTMGSKTTKPSWQVAYKQGSIPAPLFVAYDGTVNQFRQPITSKPAVAFNAKPPSGSNAPNVLVFFGTGKYLESADVTNNSINTFYGVYDKGTGDRNRSNLVGQTISTLVAPSGQEYRLITDYDVNYGSKYGWFIDLKLSTGERVVVDPIVRGTLVFFNTWVPTNSPCDAGGIGYLMSVEQLNGGKPDAPAFNVNNDLVVNDSDVVQNGGSTEAPAGEIYLNGLPAQSTFLSNKQYTPGTGGTQIKTRVVAALAGPGSGRLSWRQLTE